MIGDFEVVDEDLAGRIGKLETAHGKLETPAFFPVINPFKKELDMKYIINEFKLNNVITNAYLLFKNNVKNIDVHSFLNFNGIIMLDSGAYQILQYGNIDVDNETIVKYQIEIKPDIGVILDLPTGDTDSREKAKYTVDETIRRAKEVERLISSDDASSIIWVHPIQGGKYLDLLQYSALAADKNEAYKMLALGSPTVLLKEYNYQELLRMVITAKLNVSRGKPFHLFGGGIPHIIPFMVALGVDSFDSASYILYARDNRYMTRSRVLRLEDIEELPCSCPICSKYSVKELKEMEPMERTRLLALHNLYVILEELRETRTAIREGRLFEYLQEKAHAHPSLYLMFKEMLKYVEYLEKYDERVKGNVSGLFFFDEDSLNRPEVIRYNNYLSKRMKKKKENALIIVPSSDRELSRPYIKNLAVQNIMNTYPNYDIYILDPVFKLVPVYLSESFPLSQYESSLILDEKSIDEILSNATKLLSSKGYKEIKVISVSHIDSL